MPGVRPVSLRQGLFSSPCISLSLQSLEAWGSKKLSSLFISDMSHFFSCTLILHRQWRFMGRSLGRVLRIFSQSSYSDIRSLLSLGWSLLTPLKSEPPLLLCYSEPERSRGSTSLSRFLLYLYLLTLVLGGFNNWCCHAMPRLFSLPGRQLHSLKTFLFLTWSFHMHLSKNSERVSLGEQWLFLNFREGNKPRYRKINELVQST